MTWASVIIFNIGVGRVDPILIPFLLSSTHISIKVLSVKPNRWAKAGDLFQQFTGGIKGADNFVPLRKPLAIAMDKSLGNYYLRFKPVEYHQGLQVEIWQWVKPPTIPEILPPEESVSAESDIFIAGLII